jgi:hypothetical protein
MWNPFSPPLLSSVLLMTSLAATCVATGEEATLEEGLEGRVEELRQQIEDLLAQVPEDLREEVRRTLLGSEPSGASSEVPSSEAPASLKPAESVAVLTVSESQAIESVATEMSATEVSALEKPSTDPAVAESEPSEPTAPPKPPRQWRRRRCNTLDLLDENSDGRITSLDRDWRYLYLWVDKNQDGRLEEGELESTYALGVREIALHLDTFVRKKKGGIGEIRRKETILLDLRGNGFEVGQRPDDGALAIDATALVRGGGPELVSAEGKEIEGIQPFRKGWKARIDGKVVELTCP